MSSNERTEESQTAKKEIGSEDYIKVMEKYLPANAGVDVDPLQALICKATDRTNQVKSGNKTVGNKVTEEQQERSTISKEVESLEVVKKDATQEQKSNTNHIMRSMDV